MNTRLLLAALIAALMTAACRRGTDFAVVGKLDNLGDRMIEMVYWDGHGFKQVEVSSVDGQFRLEGSSDDYTLVELSVLGGDDIATFVARNGETIKIKGDMNDASTISIKGNKASTEYARWVAENGELLARGDAAAVNRAVAAYVRDHRESMASTLMLMTRFYTPGHELLADSLLREIDESARPENVVKNIVAALESQVSKDARGQVQTMTLYSAGDTVVNFYPRHHSLSLLVFGWDTKADSLTRTLKMLAGEYKPRRLRILEISLVPDSAMWRQSIKGDSARWVQAWAPGSASGAAVRELAVPRLPFVIVADSTGRQLYRGTSVAAMADTIERRLGR